MFYALIIAGGSGTRLWPLSRQKQPKQALRLLGERTMFQLAVDRLQPLFAPERIFIVTRAEHAPLLREQTPDIPAENFIVEPEGRGTAPAIGLAVLHIQRRDPQAVMAIVTADQFIVDTAGFRRALESAGEVARRGYLVTLGIQPTGPATGFGYIHQGNRLDLQAGLPAYCVRRFVEKPSLAVALTMVESGEYSWNSGMFIWQVERIMDEFRQQMPGFYAQMEQLRPALGTPDYSTALADLWPQVKKQTIDYGVMEGAQNVAVIPVDIGWMDIGSWASVYDLLEADADGNRAVGPFLGIDTHRTLAFGGQRLIAAIGVDDLVIVDTPDAILVCPREREQQVRDVVNRLGEKGWADWL